MTAQNAYKTGGGKATDGKRFQEGKPDDIAVVVGLVESNSQEKNDHFLNNF